MLDDSSLLTEKQVAQKLHVSVSVLRKWRMLRQPPIFIKFGKSIRYDQATIQAFASEAQVR